MNKLQNWYCYHTGSPYDPPEVREMRLGGEVYGHPRFPEGSQVTVSKLQKSEGRVVTTKNSTYRLGRIDPKYRKYLKDSNIPYNRKQPIKVW